MGLRPRVSETRAYTLRHSPKEVAAAGLAPAQARGRPTEFEAIVSTDFTTLRKRMVPVAGLAPALSTFSTLCLSFWATPACKIGASTGMCALLAALPRQSVALYGLDARRKNGRSGRTRTFVAREGVAFTARCICCSATLRGKMWELGRDSHPRPSPYEGAALTAAPPSRKSGLRREDLHLHRRSQSPLSF